jgi:hypothetical protein
VRWWEGDEKIGGGQGGGGDREEMESAAARRRPRAKRRKVTRINPNLHAQAGGSLPRVLNHLCLEVLPLLEAEVVANKWQTPRDVDGKETREWECAHPASMQAQLGQHASAAGQGTGAETRFFVKYPDGEVAGLVDPLRDLEGELHRRPVEQAKGVQLRRSCARKWRPTARSDVISELLTRLTPQKTFPVLDPPRESQDHELRFMV